MKKIAIPLLLLSLYFLFPRNNNEVISTKNVDGGHSQPQEKLVEQAEIDASLANETKQKKALERAASIIAEAKVKDAEFADYMRKYQNQQPFRKSLRKKAIDNDAQISGYLLDTWGLPNEQIEQVKKIIAKRDLSLYDLQQKRLAEQDVEKRLSLSRESDQLEKESKTALQEILGADNATTFQEWERTKRKSLIPSND